MFKNEEAKHLCIIYLVVLGLLVCSSLIISLKSYDSYKKQIIENNSNLVGRIIKNHPELEVEIVNSLTSSAYDTDKIGLNILNKYGLDDEVYLDYIENINVLKNKLILTNLLYIIISFIIFVFIHVLFLRKQCRKIRNINTYMNNILNNNYSLDIRDYKEGDISTLKNDLYKMTIKLKEQSELSLKHKKELEETLADISHQIKTPLTSMYVINDILSDNDLDKKSQQEFLNKNRNQLERIEWLVTTLLKMSRLDSGTVKLKRENVSIDELINKTIEPVKIISELKNITIVKNVTADIFALDFNWTVEALINILKNACEHTNVNGKIIIDVCDNPLYLNIKITDNGVGMNKEEQKHIFERFYKGSHNKDSVGIGLNMASKIINLQNGCIECISKPNVGTTFDIKFYKKDI